MFIIIIHFANRSTWLRFIFFWNGYQVTSNLIIWLDAQHNTHSWHAVCDTDSEQSDTAERTNMAQRYVDTWKLDPHVIVEHLIPKTLQLILLLPLLWEGFAQDFEPGCRDLLPFSLNSISGVRLWWWVVTAGSRFTFPKFIPKVLDSTSSNTFGSSVQAS